MTLSSIVKTKNLETDMLSEDCGCLGYVIRGQPPFRKSGEVSKI
tara:strand:- start:239 stop:370 length:132 start_codon:yes stop_codon:yes gene_type:complete